MTAPLTGCRWPIGIGEGASTEFAFCGVECEGPYCITHGQVFVRPTDGVDVAIQRGLLMSVKLEGLLLRLDDAMRGILWIGGARGLEAAVAGALLRVKSDRKAQPSGEGAS
jgi:hypothetical protein